jgi:hypothetical protein
VGQAVFAKGGEIFPFFKELKCYEKINVEK